ncbi:MAG: hypothetical protein ACRC35_11765, partial [Angustibacter sp.]
SYQPAPSNQTPPPTKTPWTLDPTQPIQEFTTPDTDATLNVIHHNGIRALTLTLHTTPTTTATTLLDTYHHLATQLHATITEGHTIDWND